MAKYCVANFAKHKGCDIKGLQDEANRTFEDESKYKNPIQWDKTPSNIYFAKSDDWRESIKGILEENNIKPRKDAVLFTTTVYGFSKEWEDELLTQYDEAKVESIKRSYFADCFKFENTRGVCFSAVVHTDESGNWHMQTATVPIIDHPTKEGQKSLSAKRVFGNKKHMSVEQDRFFEECGKPYGMERGKCRIDTNESKKHLTETEYKLSQEKLRLAKARDDVAKQQAKQIAEYSAKMDAIRKREEELAEREAEAKRRESAVGRRESLIEARNDEAQEKYRSATEKLARANTEAQKVAVQKAEAQRAKVEAEELIEQAKPSSMFLNIWHMVESRVPDKVRKIMSLIRRDHLDTVVPSDSEARDYMKQQAYLRAHRRLPDLPDTQSTDRELGFGD